MKVIHYSFFIMIFTLIIFSSGLALVHHFGYEQKLVFLLQQPVEYYLGFAAFLTVCRALIALYKLVPIYREFVRSLRSFSSSASSVVTKLNKKSSDLGRRNYSTRALPNNKRRDLDKSNSLNKPFNLLTYLRSKYVEVKKLIPLSNKIGTTLRRTLGLINVLTRGRVSRLAGQIRKSNEFLAFVLTMRKNHGDIFTIKWLKACHVAICKCLGQNKLLSLRSLDPELPLPRLVNGLPKIIPFEDRKLMRKGDVPTIRFWLSLFNLYRILKCTPVPKLETITAPFSGDPKGLLRLCRLTRSWNPFHYIMGPGNLTPGASGYNISKSASPSNKIAFYGILTDVAFLRHFQPRLFDSIIDFLEEANNWKLFSQVHQINRINEVVIPGADLVAPPDHALGGPRIKSSLRHHGIGPGDALSQFATKEEAAGKLRLFALVDTLTQAAMKPLHSALFELLKRIPNDGTFNQEAAIERGMTKAMIAGKAFSFDLSAATDRLPVLLSEKILASLLGNNLMARLWKRILVYRPFGFNAAVAKKLKLDPTIEYRYKVGQPMGALSSWAMLAITHHWIVQYCAKEAYPNQKEWFLGYEVLGDDIVIFDQLVADKYLEVMTVIGTEINITKSIVSRSRPVFEFAKRVCWAGAIVSGLSMVQLHKASSVGGRVANAISFANAGLFYPSPSLLIAVLARNSFSNGSVLPSMNTASIRDQKNLAIGLLALLGEKIRKGLLSLQEVALGLFFPVTLENSVLGNAIAIPLTQATRLAWWASNLPVRGDVKPVFSHMEKREYLYSSAEEPWKETILSKAKESLIKLGDNHEQFLEKLVFQMFNLRESLAGPFVPGDQSNLLSKDGESTLTMAQTDALLSIKELLIGILTDSGYNMTRVDRMVFCAEIGGVILEEDGEAVFNKFTLQSASQFADEVTLLSSLQKIENESRKPTPKTLVESPSAYMDLSDAELAFRLQVDQMVQAAKAEGIW